MMTTRNFPKKRMKEPTQLITPTLTRLDISRPNTFLHDEQNAVPLNADGYVTREYNIKKLRSVT